MAITDVSELRARVEGQREREKRLAEYAAQHKQMATFPAYQAMLLWLRAEINQVNDNWVNVEDIKQLQKMKGHVEGIQSVLDYLEKYLNYEQPKASA